MKYRYIWLLCMVAMLSLPVGAQDVKKSAAPLVAGEEEVVEDRDESEAAADTLCADSLAADSLAVDSITAGGLRLPWPENVRQGLDRLLQNDMFETSQVAIMVWDLQADSCIYRHRERQLMRPASTMKLLTAITALDRLGGSYQFKTQLKYTGKIEEGVLQGDVYCVGGMDPRFNNDDMRAFVSSLQDMGVDTIRGSIYADRSMKDADLLRCPESAFSVCTRFHTMDQIMHKMMKESDNLYAESMYYQIAASTGNRPASAKSARSVERQLLRKLGLDASRCRLTDGSGLSLYNYLSAELECQLLRYAYRNENIYPHLRPSLPIAGIDGTLRKRMRGTSASGNVRAKTGTLTGIITLAGYCTAANGHDLCFVILNNGIMHAVNARRFQDRVCALLCQP